MTCANHSAATSALLIGLALLCNAHVSAFEVATHGAITYQAWIRLLDENPTLMDRLGIQMRSDAFNTSNYYNYRAGTGGAVATMAPVAWHENFIMRQYLGIQNPLSIEGWLVGGAIREDDDSFASERTPRDDPFGNFHRVFSHFMDPANGNRGLQHVSQTLGANAAAWALDPNARTPSFHPDPERHNHYNIVTFRESMWRALTGLSREGNVVAASATERDIYWATAFRALGSVLHLNQDMAQPQHTRNDPHGGHLPMIAGHRSVFERYVDARIKRIRGFSTKDDANDLDVSILLEPINFGPSYPTPKFTSFADYWTTSNNKGLANYSNLGFFSTQTLPGSFTSYASPTNALSSYVQIRRALTRWDGSSILGGALSVTLYLGEVADLQTGGRDGGVAMLSRSAWDQAARDIGFPSRARLVKSNYDDAASLLLPRAVAYSAGILQYAFRGKFEISPPAEGVYALADHALATVGAASNGGFSRLKVKVRNATEAIPVPGGEPQAQPVWSTGELRAVVKFRRNTCYEPTTLLGQPGAPGYTTGCKTTVDEIVVSHAQQPPQSVNGANGHDFTFEFPGAVGGPIPINATDLVLQIVYRGPLGQEMDSVVVGTKNISEPSFFNFDNYSDCYRLNDGTFVTREGTFLTASMSFNGGLTYNASVVNLPPGRYSRYAILADLDFVHTKAIDGTSYDYEAIVNQELGGVSVTTPNIRQARTTTLGQPLYAYEGFGFYPTPNYEQTQSCPNAITPTPLTMGIIFQ